VEGSTRAGKSFDDTPVVSAIQSYFIFVNPTQSEKSYAPNSLGRTPTLPSLQMVNQIRGHPFQRCKSIHAMSVLSRTVLFEGPCRPLSTERRLFWKVVNALIHPLIRRHLDGSFSLVLSLYSFISARTSAFLHLIEGDGEYCSSCLKGEMAALSCW
jgi:hypothetical protein